MCHWVEEAYIIWCSKKICKSELLWKILAWPLSKDMSVLAPVIDAFALGDSCYWRSHTETVLHACLVSSCHAAALYPHATTCFSCPAPPPQKKPPSSSSSSSHWSYHFPSRSHNNPSFSLNVTCHTQLFSTAKRVLLKKTWNPFKSILLILKMLKKPLQFKRGICHPDIGISNRNTRLKTSNSLSVLLVCLHNSCPVDALEFWLIFYSSVWKDFCN